MKAKKYEKILNEVLKNHVQIDCQTKEDIIVAFKSKVIIEKHKVKDPIITACASNSEINFYYSEETIKEIHERIDKMLRNPIDL